MKQQTLAMAMAADLGVGFEQYRKLAKHDTFPATMEQIVPWQELCAVLDPHYPNVGKGRPPIGLERMLRMYFVQHWFNLADEACEEARLDSTALRRFVGIDPGSERVPDSTTLLKFRRLLEQHQLGQALFAQVGEVLQARDFTNQRTRKAGVVDEIERGKNRNKSRIRARVEHVFAVVKRLWGFAKVRYRGLEKNATRSFVALGLANIYLARTRLMA